MIEISSTEITAIIGPMCSGKTFLIDGRLKTETRLVRFDATGETCDDANVEHIWQSPAGLWARLKANPYYFRLAYHPGSDLQADFQWALKCLWRLDVYKLLVCDEFHEVCPVEATPDFVKTMLRYARHARLGLIAASQRLADVHKLFTGGARLVILFRNDDARDKDAVRSRWGKQAEEMFGDLRPLIYNDKTKETKQVPQCLVIPRGSKPTIFDFEKDAYVATGTASTEVGRDEELRTVDTENLDGNGRELDGREPDVDASSL